MTISSKHLRNICDGFEIYLLILDYNGKIQYSSWSARDLFGIKKYNNLVDYLDYNAKIVFNECLSIAIKERGITSRKINASLGDTLYTLDLRFCVPIDCTDIVYLYITPDSEQKNKSTVSVEEKLSAVGRLSDGIAHNLRSPLMVLRNIADYMAMVIKLWEQMCIENKVCIPECPIQVGKARINTLLEQMRIDIYNNVVVMTDIIDDLRAYNKNDRINEFAVINIVDLLGRVIKVLDYNTKLAVSVTLIDPTEEIPQINCVPSDIQVVITNIIENAIEQIILKKIKNGRIEVAIVKQPHSVAIKIKDNGGGIDKDLMATNKLFEPFVTTKKVGGTGLGLHSSFKIIKEHKGNIYAKNHNSRLGKGAEFIVVLPV